MNPCGIGDQVNAGIGGKPPERDVAMTEQFDNQRHRRRTDPPNDFKCLQLQIFVVRVEESSQQRKRPPGLIDQRGFGSRADLRVVR